jgi:hypothetical protein
VGPNLGPATVKGCSAAGSIGPRSAQYHGPVVQLGVHAALSRRRSRVQIPSGPPPSSDPPRAVGVRLPGRVAQLVERAPEKREVTGSTPVPTTWKFPTRACVVSPVASDRR